MNTLYHHPMSAGSRYVRLLLAEYEQDCGFQEEKPWERRADFLKLNPAGSLPVMILEGVTAVCGPYAISEYLDETVGPLMRDRRLMPESALPRAEVRRLIEWFLTKFDGEATRYIVHERVFKRLMSNQDGGGPPDSASLRAGRANLKAHLAYLNMLTGSRDWIAGNDISCADMAAGATVSVLDYLGEVHWDDYPSAKEWYASIKSRPSFRPLLSDVVRGLPPVSHYIDLDF